MRVFASPRPGYCASCDAAISGRPVYSMDEAYCCVGCANDGPCVCTYEQDLAEDGVDHLGLPFMVPAPVAPVAPVATVATGSAPVTEARPLSPAREAVGIR